MCQTVVIIFFVKFPGQWNIMFKLSRLKEWFLPMTTSIFFHFSNFFSEFVSKKNHFECVVTEISFRPIFSLSRKFAIAENDYFLHMSEVIFPFIFIAFLCHLLLIVLLMYLYVKIKLMHFHCITQSNLWNRTPENRLVSFRV